MAHVPTASSWKVDEEKIQFERKFLCRNLKVAGGHEIIMMMMMMAVGLLFCGFLKTIVGGFFSVVFVIFKEGDFIFKYVGQSVNPCVAYFYLIQKMLSLRNGN